MTLEQITEYWPHIATAVGALIGYGELKQKVSNNKEAVEAERKARQEHFDLVRSDIKRVDEKVEELTAYLLRVHGSNSNQVGR